MLKRPTMTSCIVKLLSLLLLARRTAAFFPGLRRSAPAPSDISTVHDVSIRIRKTVESDVPEIAEMLASAVVQDRDTGGMARWRIRMDQMFAKADIEALLRGRLCAMREGQLAWQRISQVYADESLEDRLKIFWATSDRMRNLIEKASQETGEANLWQTHNFVLTPPDRNWFNHLQLTAVDVTTGKIAGFCEVAMLSNPAEDDTCRITTAIVENDDNDEGDRNLQFSPGITNLATATSYRRQGIATKLLRCTERFVRLHWKAERMGLYVEKANDAAMGLYRKLGYSPEVTCDGGDVLGEMWYMVKNLERQDDQQGVLEENDQSTTVVTN